MADRIKSLREVKRYYDNIWIGLKQVVMVWRRKMMAADVEPVGRKANCDAECDVSSLAT